MSSVADWLGMPEMALLVLLATSHLLGEFLFQTRVMVERKDDWRVLARHVAVVFTLHLVAVSPLVGRSTATLATAIELLVLLGLLHALVDSLKAYAVRRCGGVSLGLFALDQAAHGVAILGVWWLWRARAGSEAGGELGVATWLPTELHLVTAGVLLVGAYVLNGTAAATVIRLFLARFPVLERADEEAPETDVERMGWTIGILERMFLLSLVVLGRWEAVGWLFAGKTVARFRELDNRAFSEYYLIGTLSSLLFAAVTGSVVRWALTGTL